MKRELLISEYNRRGQRFITIVTTTVRGEDGIGRTLAAVGERIKHRSDGATTYAVISTGADLGTFEGVCAIGTLSIDGLIPEQGGELGD